MNIGTYDPRRDGNRRVVECASDYVARMRAILPTWPEVLIVEWLLRHAGHIEKYAFLNFEAFTFRRERWPLARVPGREAFHDPDFYDNFSQDFEDRAREPYDWLAQYMAEHGTWNTPILLLNNSDCLHVFPDGEPLRAPFHLLEGHRRLSFLNALRLTGRAAPEHDVWIVTAPVFDRRAHKKANAPGPKAAARPRTPEESR